MKRCWPLGLSLAVLTVVSTGSALATPLPGTAAPGFALSVAANEKCKGSFVLLSFPSGTFISSGSLSCSIALDPISGMLVPTFTLPVEVTAGDVLVLEPATPTGQVNSDLLRFIPNQPDGSSTKMAFFSELGDTFASDVGIPSVLQSNNVALTEAGPETNNVFGFDITTPNSFASYHITSDMPVPEPASILLLATGAGIVWLAGSRHRNRLMLANRPAEALELPP